MAWPWQRLLRCVASSSGSCRAPAVAVALAIGGFLSSDNAVSERRQSLRADLESVARRLELIEATLLQEPPRTFRGYQKRVIVLGAGIIGASTALALTEAGCDVTVLEADAEPASHGSCTSSSWAWINSNSKHPASYHDLNVASMELWRGQGVVPVQWSGSLVVRQAGTQTKHPESYPHRGPITSTVDLLALEPGLDSAYVKQQQETGGIEWMHYPTEGFLSPVSATRTLLQRALQHDDNNGGSSGGGAAADKAERGRCRAFFNQHVLELLLDDVACEGEGGGVVVRTEGARFEADCVVVALGNGAAPLLGDSCSLHCR